MQNRRETIVDIIVTLLNRRAIDGVGKGTVTNYHEKQFKSTISQLVRDYTDYNSEDRNVKKAGCVYWSEKALSKLSQLDYKTSKLRGVQVDHLYEIDFVTIKLLDLYQCVYEEEGLKKFGIEPKRVRDLLNILMTCVVTTDEHKRITKINKNSNLTQEIRYDDNDPFYVYHKCNIRVYKVKWDFSGRAIKHLSEEPLYIYE